jgi:hypothetical protein
VNVDHGHTTAGKEEEGDTEDNIAKLKAMLIQEQKARV